MIIKKEKKQDKKKHIRNSEKTKLQLHPEFEIRKVKMVNINPY